MERRAAYYDTQPISADPVLKLASCSIRRKFAYDLSSPWTSVRIIARISHRNAWANTAAYMSSYGIGLCSSSGRGYHDMALKPTGNFLGASPTPGVGSTYPQGWISHRAGTARTTAGAGGQSMIALPTVRSIIAVDISYASPLWTVTFYSRTNGLADSDIDDATYATYVSGAVDPSTNIRHSKISASVNEALVDEGTNGTLDSVNFYMSYFATEFEIHNFDVTVLA